MKENKLLVYTGRQKKPMDFIQRKDLFFYPFTQMISRTEYKIDLFKFGKASESIKEILSSKLPSYSFEECCFVRARELRSLNKKHYYIFYSGGIDSTGLMVALMMTWSAEDLKKITVVLTSHSILENPSFYKSTIQKFPLFNYMDGITQLLTQEDSLVVTGELGDQLFGSGMLLMACKKYGNQFLRNDYKETGFQVIDEYILKDGKRGEGHGKALFEHIVPIAEECPFPIKTNFDFFWWFNFTQEWQFAKYKFYESKLCPTLNLYGKNIVHFYDTIYFQKWSLNNHDLKIKDTWDSYKYLNKEFIFNYTKDPDHLKQLKLQSLKNTYFFQDFRIALNMDQQEINSYQGLQDYVR